MILDSLNSLARHLPGQALRTAVAVSPFDKPMGDFKEETWRRVLPWAAGGIAAYVAYQVLFGRGGVAR